MLPGHNGGHGVLYHSSHAPSTSKCRYDGGLEAYERVDGAGEEENSEARYHGTPQTLENA